MVKRRQLVKKVTEEKIGEQDRKILKIAKEVLERGIERERLDSKSKEILKKGEKAVDKLEGRGRFQIEFDEYLRDLSVPAKNRALVEKALSLKTAQVYNERMLGALYTDIKEAKQLPFFTRIGRLRHSEKKLEETREKLLKTGVLIDKEELEANVRVQKKLLQDEIKAATKEVREAESAIPKEVRPLLNIYPSKNPEGAVIAVTIYKDPYKSMRLFREPIATGRGAKGERELNLMQLYKIEKYEDILELMVKESLLYTLRNDVRKKEKHIIDKVISKVEKENKEQLGKKSVRELQEFQKEGIKKMIKVVTDVPLIHTELASFFGAGPVGGIIAAKRAESDVAWLAHFNSQVTEVISQKLTHNRAAKALKRIDPYRTSMSPDKFEAAQAEVIKKLIHQTPQGLEEFELNTIISKTGVPKEILKTWIKEKRNPKGDEERL